MKSLFWLFVDYIYQSSKEKTEQQFWKLTIIVNELKAEINHYVALWFNSNKILIIYYIWDLKYLLHFVLIRKKLMLVMIVVNEI